MKKIALTVYIVLLIIAAGFGVGAATKAGVLVPAAAPFALALILIMRLMDAKAELLSWAAFTVGLLAGTYLSTGSPLEYLVFIAYVALAALGIFKSPYFLALAWLIHPAWDFVPRQLPANLQELPLACALFDIPIGLYLLWGSWKKRWQPVSDSRSTRDALIKSGKALFAGTVILAASAVVAATLGSEYLNGIALATALAVIFCFRAIGSAGELVAWAVLTGWVGMTYAHTGGVADALFFFVFVAVSAYGAFRSPYALGIAWLVFMLYSFLPHHAHHMPADLPMATVFYCLPIGIYLLWASRSKRLKPDAPDASQALPDNPEQRTSFTRS